MTDHSLARFLAPAPTTGARANGNPDGRSTPRKVTLLSSGAILTEVLNAAALLADQGVASDVLSVTSWSELARDGLACEQQAMQGAASALHSEDFVAFVARQLAITQGPVIAATDYVRAVPESVRAFMPEGRRYITLGTDGFGRSDTRSALWGFFGVDAASVVRTALHALG